ncbi:MAG: SPFH domain-containing protein, partial [Thermoproteota archaeon]|nr:SPFH domain-containing protein [Thermoproteota archaeon]
MVDVATIITVVVLTIIIGVIGFFIYNRRFGGRLLRRGPGRYRRMTREGEPLEDYEAGGAGTRMVSRSSIRLVIPIIIGFIILIVVLASAIRIVDAGYRGVLLSFGAVDTSLSLNEGIHFVVPFRDNVVQMEVRTQKIVENAASASRDLQDVSTQVALNYHINPDTAQVLYQQLGFD